MIHDAAFGVSCSGSPHSSHCNERRGPIRRGPDRRPRTTGNPRRSERADVYRIILGLLLVSGGTLSLTTPGMAGPAGKPAGEQGSAPSRPVATADSPSLHYSLHVGGFTAAQATIAVHLGDSVAAQAMQPPSDTPSPTRPQISRDGEQVQGVPYALDASMETVGVARMLVTFQSQSHSAGWVIPDGMANGPSAGVHPIFHRVRNLWRDAPRSVDIRYAPSPAVAPQSTARPHDERTPVSAQQTVGSMDPLSAVLALGLKAAALPTPFSAPVSQVVFDGRRLYQLRLEALRPAPIAAPAYKGPGWRGTVVYTRLGGRSTASFFKTTDAPQDADIQFAPGRAFGLPYPIPLRVSVDTLNFGGLVVRLDDVGSQPLPVTSPAPSPSSAPPQTLLFSENVSHGPNSDTDH